MFLNNYFLIRKQFFRNNFFLIISLFIVATLHLWLFWQGTLTPDSESQYAMAISGIYSDHHPPLMSFVWRYLDKIYAGAGLILLLHLSLLYAAVFYLIKSLINFRWRFLYLLLPWIPQVLIFSGFIWKDVGYAFSFLFVGAYLTYLTARKIIPLKRHCVVILLFLFYGTAIKFQAKYCAPIFLSWLVLCLSGYQFQFKKFFIKFLLISAPFYVSLHLSNCLLVPETKQNHSWQYVKIYDLAAISVALNKPCFPENLLTKNFSMEKLNTLYNPRRVDDIAFGNDALLRIGSNGSERSMLWKYWAITILHHPLIYLKHRASILLHGLICIPAQESVTNFYNKLNDDQTPKGKVLRLIAKIFGVVLLSHIFTAFLCLAYLILSIVTLTRSYAAIPLLFFNATGFSMLVVLFFLSMAGGPRYTYITICMVHATHIFAFICLKTRLANISGYPKISNITDAKFL